MQDLFSFLHIKEFLSYLDYNFVKNAFFSGMFMSIACSILGVFVVLKKQSMIGDGLSHVSFAAVSLSLFFGQSPFVVSVPFVVCASFLIQYLAKKTKMHADSAIALVSSTCIAIGTMAISLSEGFSQSIYKFLFGSILTVTREEIYYSAFVCFVVISLVFIFYKSLFAISYDEEFAKMRGVKVEFYDYMLSALFAITVLIGIRTMGTMLVSALFIFPALSTIQISKYFAKSLIFAAFFSIMGLLVGMWASLSYNLPTSSSIVIVHSIIFLFCCIISKIRRK